MSRPNWKLVKTYPAIVDGKDYRAWAWEFLRRNVDYQKESTKALEVRMGPLAKSVANRYGLTRLINYKLQIDLSDGVHKWLSETICRHQVVGTMPIKHTVLKEGEIALVFDFKQTIAAGPAAIDSMLYNARSVLLSARLKYVESIGESKQTLRLRTPKIRKAKLLIWLRVYDALIYSKVPKLEAAQVLYPECFTPDVITGATQESKAIAKISADLRRAQSMVKDEYLALPPLDYLQDKSKGSARNLTTELPPAKAGGLAQLGAEE